FAGESQANRRYLFFAEKAEKEGHPGIAKVFRAAAAAETVHARNHLVAMGGIGSTKENLQTAIKGESYEFMKMYPDFIEQAQADNSKRAEISFTHANAADSRVTLETQQEGQPSILVNFDNATKLLSFGEPNISNPHRYIGVVTYGQAAIGLRTANSFIPEFEEKLPKERLPIEDFAKRLSKFFMDQWKAVMQSDYAGPPMTFVVGGFNEGEPYGRVYLIEMPNAPSPIERS
ncbi:unnamed protein product, partial [marine sediment metagenome]